MAWAISLSMSWFRPSSWNSSPHMRRPTQKSLPTASRTACSTCMPKRRRFSRQPPYSSVRKLVRGLQNWSIRCWWAADISMPSMPAACTRRAAAAKSAMMRRISSGSMVLALPWCTGSRTPDGLTRCGQCSPCQDERRPMWVAWIMMRAPWRCMASARRPSGSMTRSVERLTERHQPCGLSGETMLEPPQMASPRPPLAFSS